MKLKDASKNGIFIKSVSCGEAHTIVQKEKFIHLDEEKMDN